MFTDRLALLLPWPTLPQVKVPAERVALFGALAAVIEAPPLKRLLQSSDSLQGSAPDSKAAAVQLSGKVFAFMSAFYKEESERWEGRGVWAWWRIEEWEYQEGSKSCWRRLGALTNVPHPLPGSQ